MIREGIQAVVEGCDLTEAEAAAVMTEIMDGDATPAQIAAFIVGLRIKGETVGEITGCARVMRDKATFIRTPPGSVPVDTAGTGGDRAHTFNISTTAAFVAAGAGVVMAMGVAHAATAHLLGNRARNGTSGRRVLLRPDPSRRCRGFRRRVLLDVAARSDRECPRSGAGGAACPGSWP